MSPTVKARAMSRLYVTRVNSNTSKPGNISADTYSIANGSTSFKHFCYYILEINSQNCNKKYIYFSSYMSHVGWGSQLQPFQLESYYAQYEIHHGEFFVT